MKSKYTGILFLSIMLMILAGSCQKELSNEIEMPVTRAYGEKTPKVVAYIEVNDTDPRNTMLYRINDEPFLMLL